MSGSWTDEPWLAIDTESTGVDPFTARVVELAAVEILPDGSIGERWATIVDPGVKIPDEAAAVHGITTERARAEGVAPRIALAILTDRIFDHGYRPVVGFNMRYDWPLLLAEAARHGVDFPCFAPVLDPYLLDRLCDRFRKGKRQLTLVAEHYGVPLGDRAHGALADATAAGRVMRKIVERFPELTDLNLPGLWLHQAHGHEQDRQRFVDYMRRNRDQEFDTPAGWPVPVEAGR